MNDFGWDTTWFLAVNTFAKATPWLQPVMAGWANYGVLAFGALLLAGYLLARRDGRPESMAAELWATIATLVAVGVNQPLVAVFHEARPYTQLPGILVLAHRTSDPSFPSDHATMAGAVVGGLLLVDRRLGVIAALAAAVMAFSRVYIAAHYPHDVVVGLGVGLAVALGGWFAMRGALIRLTLWLAHSRVGHLLTGPP
jgi:undecaprenyl-diphosphatase